MSIIIAIDCSNCFMLLLSNECRIYFVNYSIAIVVSVTMNAANVNSIACVSFSELFIMFIFISYIYIIYVQSYLHCEIKTKR